MPLSRAGLVATAATCIVLMLFNAYCSNASAPTCYDAYDCAFEGSISTTSDIQCYGYNSCRQNPSISARSSNNIYCFGSFSCYKVSSLTTTSSAYDNPVYCYGLFSCALVDYLRSYRGNVYCYGELACYGSYIDASYYSTNDVVCYGDRSCQDAIIYSEDQNYIYGHLGALNAKFYSTDAAVNYWFHGAESGKNAEVICQSGDVCYIYCYGNACNDLTLTCNSCSSFSVTCDDSADLSDVCDSQETAPLFISDIMPELPSLIDIEMSSYENSYDPCFSFETNAINCEDYTGAGTSAVCGAHSLDTTNSPSDYAPVCCTAYNACDLADIESRIPDYDEFIGDTAIRCDGYLSCEDTTELSAQNGNIYLAGFRANYLSNTIIQIIADDGDNTNSYEYDIICSGRDSCELTGTIQNANNLYCGGTDSCRDINLIQNINNIYGYGSASLYSVTLITDIKDSVYCASYRSCYETVFNNVTNNVYGNGYQALALATITNVGGNVICKGEEACYQAEIEMLVNDAYDTNVICNGEESCREATIRKATNILVSGENALYSTVIISELDGNTLNMEIEGTNDYVFYLYCNSTDICKIDCYSEKSCRNLYLKCFGKCYVRCDESNNIECPGYGVYYELEPTQPPSSHPTSVPTGIPTIVPSNIPTIVPTIVPSNIPSNMPSSMPSNVPTLNPSETPTARPTTIPTSAPIATSTLTSVNSVSDIAFVRVMNDTTVAKNDGTWKCTQNGDSINYCLILTVFNQNCDSTLNTNVQIHGRRFNGNPDLLEFFSMSNLDMENSEISEYFVIYHDWRNRLRVETGSGTIAGGVFSAPPPESDYLLSMDSLSVYPSNVSDSAGFAVDYDPSEWELIDSRTVGSGSDSVTDVFEINLENNMIDDSLHISFYSEQTNVSTQWSLDTAFNTLNYDDLTVILMIDAGSVEFDKFVIQTSCQ